MASRTAPSAIEELKHDWREAERQPQMPTINFTVLNRDPMYNQEIPLFKFYGGTLYNRESLFDQIEAVKSFERWDGIFYCHPDSSMVDFPGQDTSYSRDVGFVWKRSATNRDERADCKNTIDNYEKDRIFRKAYQGYVLVLTLRLDRLYTHSPYIVGL
jgi:hypothetical protein